MEQLSILDSATLPTRVDRWSDKFEKQAILDPSRTAVISGAGSMTYGELNTRSSGIAKLLRSRGIGRGDFVGLGLHRCLELPSALLGILKSGAAYVPLDPGYPSARIKQMIGSADLKHVVTRTHLTDRFPNVETTCIDDEILSTAASGDRKQLHDENDPIQTIFASGSTGQPRAAFVDHRDFENLLRWYSIELEMGPGDRTLIISSPSFDLTQKNFFAPLITGGTLILDDCPTHDISRISTLIRKLDVTLIHCPPSVFYPLVDAAAEDSYVPLSSLRFAVLGGEPVSIRRLCSWLEHPNCHAKVVNSYGPTECTDICAYHRLHRGNLDGHPFVPLGREIPNVEVGIVDDPLDPSPAAEPNGIRDFLSSRLPSPVFQSEFPLTSNGNVNRPALSGNVKPATPPGSSMESKVLALWSEILDHPVDDPTANFFDLGGNSIHLAILHIRLLELTGCKFPIIELFALPNARLIADFLSPSEGIVATPPAQDRARQARAGYSGFRRPASR